MASSILPSNSLIRVSIGLPVFNGESYLREAINSVLSQSFVDFELIISDNCSTDNTENICLEFAKSDRRISYFRQSQNIGARANYQFLLDKASAPYFMWVASDDLQEDTFVQSLYDVLISNPDVVCAMSDVKNISESSSEITFFSYLSDIRLDVVRKSWPLQRKRFFRNPTSSIFFCICGLFRVTALRSAGQYLGGLNKYASSSEVSFLAQLSLLGPIVSIPQPLKIYRRHSQSMYHQEQALINYVQRVHCHSLVSLDLIVVIWNSNLPFFVKIDLYITVFVTWLPSFLFLSLRALTKSFVTITK